VRLLVSAKADYALRALVVLGARPVGTPMKSAEIARLEDLPQKFLENILVDLRRKGLVASLRGPAGGFRLTRPPEDITVAEVLFAVDGPLTELGGPQHGREREARASALVRVWNAAEESVRHLLESVTVADLVPGGTPEPDPEPAHASNSVNW
jgi:Rrf2 family protein